MNGNGWPAPLCLGIHCYTLTYDDEMEKNKTSIACESSVKVCQVCFNVWWWGELDVWS